MYQNTLKLSVSPLRVALIFSVFLHLTGFYFLSGLTFDSIKAVPELTPITVKAIVNIKTIKPSNTKNIQQAQGQSTKHLHPVSSAYQNYALPNSTPLYKIPIQAKTNQTVKYLKTPRVVGQISLLKFDSSVPKKIQNHNIDLYSPSKVMPVNFKFKNSTFQKNNLTLKSIKILTVSSESLINNSSLEASISDANPNPNKVMPSRLLADRGFVDKGRLKSKIRSASAFKMNVSKVLPARILTGKEVIAINKTNPNVRPKATTFGLHEELLKNSNITSITKNVLPKHDSFSGENIGKVRQGFRKTIWDKVASVKYYPRIARKRGFEGKPVVSFTLGIRGELLKLNLVQSSDYTLLNEAALETIRRGSPYPPIPKPLRQDSISFKLPISYIME